MQILCILSFLALCSLILYTIAGYPAVLAWLARRSPKPVRKRETNRTISVIIAVHNGERFLAAKLNSILNLDYPRELVQIIVVSDGSTDGTEDVAREFVPQGVELIRVPRGGKPSAVNAGLAVATGEILILTDVRQYLEPQSVSRLVSCFEDPAVGVVSGDLLIREGNREEKNVGLYWNYERAIRKRLATVDSMFGATGPFYAMRRELAVTIPPETLLDDLYLPLSAFFRGYRLFLEEDARAYDYPTSVNIEFRRKVRTLAGNYQILRQYPALLSSKNRMLFHYISYKLFRLLLPWMFVAVFVVSFGLPWPWSAIVIALQALFYVLALADLLVPASSFLKRLTSPAWTFVSLLFAAACAVSIFFVPPQRLWKPTQVQVASKD